MDHPRRFRLVRITEDVRGVALVIGDDEVPVAGIDRAGGGVDLELVDALGEVRLEVANALRRLQGVGASGCSVESHYLGAEGVVWFGAVQLYDCYIALM